MRTIVIGDPGELFGVVISYNGVSDVTRSVREGSLCTNESSIKAVLAYRLSTDVDTPERDPINVRSDR